LRAAQSRSSRQSAEVDIADFMNSNSQSCFAAS
jgi:hypothetical protein